MQKDKLDLVWPIVFATFFMLLLVVAGIMLFNTYVRRKNKLLLERELMKVQFEQTLLESQLEIQKQTFAEISHELHDNICQVLSFIRLSVNTLDVHGESEKLAHIDGLLERGLTDIRQLSHSLDEDQLRITGWVEPLNKLMNTLRNTGKFSASAEIEDNLPTLGDGKPIILFRMIQETINNIVKHAEADTILVKAKNENKKLVISIRDNGKGFDTDQMVGGLGLRNLEKRSKMIHADLDISSKSGDGTCVTITINTEQIG
jgi:signal transduction histidine kinase